MATKGTTKGKASAKPKKSKGSSKPKAAMNKLTLPKGGVPHVINFNDDSQTNVFEVLASYDPNKDGTWQEFVKSDRVKGMMVRTLRINETGLSIPLDGKFADAAAAISANATIWGAISQNWQATAAYGNQHFSKDGPLHFDGVNRLSTEDILRNASLFIEVLAQRAGLKDMAPENPEYQIAPAALSALVQFIRNRPGEVKEQKKAQMYAAIKSAEGTEVVSKTETTSA